MAALGPGHPSDWRLLNPCQDSGARVPQGSRSDASAASALARDLAGLQDAGAGGMAACVARAPPLPLRRGGHAVGRGGELCADADVARRAKGRQSAPGAARSPGGQPATGGCRRPTVSAAIARRFCMSRRSAPARRALRALEVVEKVLTSLGAPWAACGQLGCRSVLRSEVAAFVQAIRQVVPVLFRRRSRV
jgi:hypothetical protein